MSTVLLLSTADTDLLAARASGAPFRIGNPTRIDVADELPALIEGASVAVVRLLGGKRAWEDGLAALKASGIPTVLLGGESVPDAELMAESSVPAGVVAEALRYLVEGGPGNLVELSRFLSDTVLLTGVGFAEPEKMPEWGVHGTRAYVEGAPRWACSSTAPTSSPATPPSSTSSATASRPGAPTPLRCTWVRCAAPSPRCTRRWAGRTR